MTYTLEDTIPYMKGDYRMRALAELLQLNVRIDGIKKMLDAWDKNELDYIPSNPKELSVEQLRAMEEYRKTLIKRLEYIFGFKSNPNE